MNMKFIVFTVWHCQWRQWQILVAVLSNMICAAAMINCGMRMPKRRMTFCWKVKGRRRMVVWGKQDFLSIGWPPLGEYFNVWPPPAEIVYFHFLSPASRPRSPTQPPWQWQAWLVHQVALPSAPAEVVSLCISSKRKLSTCHGCSIGAGGGCKRLLLEKQRETSNKMSK